MIDWPRLVADHARRSRVDLPRHAVVELAEHLEDLYAAARADGADHATALARALAALDAASLTDLSAPAQRLRTTEPRVLTLPASGSPFRSLSMLHALRLAVRQFRRHPAFAVLTVLILGLGIGSGVAVYTVVDTVLLRPLPYREPDRLVMLWDVNHEQGLRHEPISPVNFMDYRNLDVFEDAAGWWRPDVNLADPGVDPVRVRTIETGGNLFAVLGVSPQIGPGFPAGGPLFSRADRIAVISDRLWRTRYNGDPTLVGRQLQMNGNAYTIAGVMPPRFDFPGDIDVWQRSTWDFTQHSRGAHFMEAVARLAPGATLTQADGAVVGLAQRLERDFAATNRAWTVRLIPLMEDQLGYYRPALFVLFGAVGLLMTIGCLNVASLLLTRTLSRDREIGVRTALGASRRHLIIQLLAEAAVLSIAGAAAGTLAAMIALPLIVQLTPVDIPRLSEAAVSWRVLLFALSIGVVTTMVFGLVPAAALVRRSATADLKSGARGSSRASRGLYRGLVAGELALACALLVASGLLVRTVGRMADVPTGVGNPSVVTASVQLSTISTAQVQGWQTIAETHHAILEQVRAQPGVRAAGAANFLPLDPGWRVPFSLDGQPPVRPEELPQAQIHSVSAGFFEAIGASASAGRLITDRDRVDAPPALVVNETFARQFLPGRNPVGQVVLIGARGIGPLGFNIQAPILSPRPAATPGGPPPPPAAPMRYEIVGVVRDVRNIGLSQPIEPAIYYSAMQFPFRAMFVAVDAVDRATGVAAIQSALRAVAPAVPMADVRTWHERMSTRTGEPRLLMTVLVFFGALAALLALLGIYGLFSWLVALKERELAIRLTLGARPAGIGWTIVRQGLVLSILGLGAGWLLVRSADSLLSRVLFEIAPGDLSSTASAALLLLAGALVACLVPAWRAMRVNPIDGLRSE